VVVKATVDGVEFVACGGGGGATHQIDGVALTAQDPINFLDTSEFDWTNPAAGDLSLALKATSVADSKLASNYSGVGSCTNQFVRATVDNAAPTCESIADADLPSTNALDTELHAQSHVLDGADHTVSGLTVGNYLRALTASTFGFFAIVDGDLPASIARDSELHAQSHVLAGSDHTASGLTIGNVVRATGATTFAWQQLGFSDLSGSATDSQVPDDITIATQDNNFSLLDDLDNTKVLQFQLSSITTATTRTVTVPDANGEMSLLGQTIEDGELATDFISEIELDTEAELEAQLTDVTDVLTDAAGSCTNQVVTAVNDGAAPTCSNVSSAMISDGAVASPDLATANKQFTVSFVLESPVAADDALLQHKFSQAVTIQRVSCSTDTGTVTIQFDERAEATPNTAGTDVMTSTLVCDNNTEATTAFSNAGIAADVPLNLDIDAVASSPGVVRIHIDYQID
jgi:hypothetical protein